MRYGKLVYVVFCCIVFFVNIVIIIVFLVVGKLVISVFIKDVLDEFIVFVLVVLFGFYCFFGGLGIIFYILYFNIVIIFVGLIVIVVSIVYIDNINVSMFKYVFIDVMYDVMFCIKLIEGNYEDFLLIFWIRFGVIYGLFFFFMVILFSFID